MEKLVLKLTAENPSWGSDRIVGVLANLQYQISDSTVDNIRKRETAFRPRQNGARIRPGPISSRRIGNGLIAADFFATEVLCGSGLITFYTLFVIKLRSRLVHACGMTASPNAEWMKQVARQLTDGMRTGLLVGRPT